MSPKTTNEPSSSKLQRNKSIINPAKSSDLWKYMEKLANEKARCKSCNKILSRQNGATTGLRKHLFQIHKIESFRSDYVKKPTTTYELTDVQKKEINSLIVQCIVEDGRSFSDFRRPGILKVLKRLSPTYSPPHRNTIQRQLQRLYTEKRSQLIDDLSNVDAIGVTCDFWYDKRLYSYISLTGHYITSTNEFVSKILLFSCFQNRHTTINVSEFIKKELKELNIYTKTYSITTDGAPNMLKISESLHENTKQIICFAHKLHLIVCNGLGLWIRKEKKAVESTNSSTSSRSMEIDSDEEDLTDDFAVNSSLSSSGSTNSISSHCDSSETMDISDQSSDSTNQSNSNSDSFEYLSTDNSFIDEDTCDSSFDVYDNWSIDIIEDPNRYHVEEIQEYIGIIISKCRSLVKLINKSSILMNYVMNLRKLFDIHRSIRLDCKSRWNSTQKLIETIILYKRIINRINSEKHEIGLNKKQTVKLLQIELNQSDWKMLEILEKLLKPFVEVTDAISGSQYATIGVGYFAVVQIRDFLDDENLDDLVDQDIILILKSLLSKQLDKYFILREEQWNMLQNCAYFDPLGFGCLSRRERRSIESNLLQDYQDNIHRDNFGIEGHEARLTTSTVTTTSTSITRFLDSIGKRNQLSTSNIRSKNTNDLNDELSSYRSLAQKEHHSIVLDGKKPNVMKFWQKNQPDLPLLSKMAFKYLVSSATSVASESAFSTASYLLRKQRSRLSPNNLCYTMFLKDKMNENDILD